MIIKTDKTDNFELAQILEEDLLKLYGPLLSGESLRKALGFRTQGAVRQAIWQGRVPVPVFLLEHRKGYFALSKDVASWLAEKRNSIKPVEDLDLTNNDEEVKK